MKHKENIQPAFESFLERHRLFIWKLCNRYADGDPDVGLDYVQDISVLLWLRFGKLRKGVLPQQEQKWIHYIARDYFRSHSRHNKITLESYVEESLFVTEPENPSEILAEYLVCLTPPECDIINLYIQGFKVREVAQLLNISLSSTQRHLHNAIVHMREYAQKIENQM
jgi:RNA polymerase sigma factor (sigma-70 family)